EWKGGYPNPAFSRMTELDGAWATRILTRFTPELIAQALTAGDYTQPRHRAFLQESLEKRRDKVRRRWSSRLSPLADVVVEGDRVCATDLAHQARTWPTQTFRYAGAAWSGVDLEKRAPLALAVEADAKVCTTLPRTAA